MHKAKRDKLKKGRTHHGKGKYRGVLPGGSSGKQDASTANMSAASSAVGDGHDGVGNDNALCLSVQRMPRTETMGHGSFTRTFYSERISQIIAKLSQKYNFYLVIT